VSESVSVRELRAGLRPGSAIAGPFATSKALCTGAQSRGGAHTLTGRDTWSAGPLHRGSVPSLPASMTCSVHRAPFHQRTSCRRSGSASHAGSVDTGGIGDGSSRLSIAVTEFSPIVLSTDANPHTSHPTEPSRFRCSSSCRHPPVPADTDLYSHKLINREATGMRKQAESEPPCGQDRASSFSR